MCRDGSEQSPINLTNAVAIEDSGFERRLGQVVLADEQIARIADIIGNGHTIQVTTDVPMALGLGATTGQPQDRLRFALEMQLGRRARLSWQPWRGLARIYYQTLGRA